MDSGAAAFFEDLYSSGAIYDIPLEWTHPTKFRATFTLTQSPCRSSNEAPYWAIITSESLLIQIGLDPGILLESAERKFCEMDTDLLTFYYYI